MTALPLLPSFLPVVETVAAPEGFTPPRGSVVVMPDGRLIVDYWKEPSGYKLKTWRRADHPNLADLPGDAPKSVKALFTAAGQLRLLRATEYDDTPFRAWDEYLNTRRNAK